jgi:hypothetical protein
MDAIPFSGRGHRFHPEKDGMRWNRECEARHGTAVARVGSGLWFAPFFWK